MKQFWIILSGLGLALAGCGDNGDAAEDGSGGSGGSGGDSVSYCVQCEEKGDCDANAECVEGQCIPIACSTDDDCSSVAVQDKCFNAGTTESYCGCSGDTVCQDSFMAFCSTTTNQCAQCDDVADCTVAGYEFCTTQGFCGCSDDSGCSGFGAGDCDEATGACILCASDADCTAGSLNTCYNAGTAQAYCGCGEDADCGGFPAGACTSEGLCAMCNEDSDCADNGYGDTCDVDNFLCSCTEDNECQDSGGSPSLGVKGVCAAP